MPCGDIPKATFSPHHGVREWALLGLKEKEFRICLFCLENTFTNAIVPLSTFLYLYHPNVATGTVGNDFCC